MEFRFVGMRILELYLHSPRVSPIFRPAIPINNDSYCKKWRFGDT